MYETKWQTIHELLRSFFFCLRNYKLILQDYVVPKSLVLDQSINQSINIRLININTTITIIP